MRSTHWRRALALLTLAAGCAELPSLATNGEIRAGTDGSCPDGFVERLGRCCPANSTAQSCPSGPGLFGGACTTNDNCTSSAQTRVCLAGPAPVPSYPGGYCSERCTGATGSDCAGGTGACIANPLQPQQSLCLRRCTLPAGQLVGPCSYRASEPNSYRCIAIDPTENFTVCLPNCIPNTADNHGCGTGRVCVALASDPSFGACSRVCVLNAGCPSGWTCEAGRDTALRGCRPPG